MLGGDVEESTESKETQLPDPVIDSEPSDSTAPVQETISSDSNDQTSDAANASDPAIPENGADAVPQNGSDSAENSTAAAVAEPEPILDPSSSSNNNAQSVPVISSNGDNVSSKDDKAHNAEIKTTSTTSQSRRKFRVTGIHFPGDDISHPDIVATMLASQSFHIWLERESHKPHGRKKGGISFAFDDESSALQAYLKIKDLILNGVKLNFSYPKWFNEHLSQQPQEISCTLPDILQPIEDDPDRHQKVFVEQLLPNADENLIYAVFSKDNLKTVDIRVDTRKTDGSKCAMLTFHDRETAEQAKEYDEFAVDDGEVSRPMRVSLYVDYLKRLEAEKQKKNRPPPATVHPPEADISSRHENENASAPRRSMNEQKGKAGNLWSAQIVENRGEPIEVVRAKDKGRLDHESHGKNHRSSSTMNENPPNVEAQWSTNTNNAQQKPAETADAASVTAPPPPPPPPEETEESKPMRGQEEQEAGQRPPSRAAGEMGAHELSVLIEAAMVRGRINWAELNTLEELWTLVHHASKDAGWQPEMSLKEAMAVVLDRAYRSVEADWQRDHIASLIRIWKKELEVDSRSQIRKQLQLAEPDVASQAQTTGSNDGSAGAPGADYTPPPSEKRGKKRSKANKKALMQMMGVGALLADVKKEVAEQEQQDKASSSTKVKSNEHEKRKRKHSASESGEASTTTEEGEDSDWEEGTASSSEYRRGQQRGKQNEKRLPPKLQNRKKPAHKESKPTDTTATAKSTAMPTPEQMASWMSTMMGGGGGTNVQQQWMAQMMPMMLQMMPMMMQAQRMMAAATANAGQAQQQQQLMQMMQQMMGSMSGQSATPSHPQPYQQASPSPATNPMAAWMQQQQQHPAHHPVSAAPALPTAGHQAPYFGRHQQPPPPPSGPYGSGYPGRGGDQGPMYHVRGNYTSR